MLCTKSALCREQVSRKGAKTQSAAAFWWTVFAPLRLCGRIILRSGTLLLLVTLATLATPLYAQEEKEEVLENIPAVLSGIRANVVEGDVVFLRETAKFKLESGHKLEQDDVIRTGANGRAELLLQPGNLLRIGPDTECQFVDDRYDRLKLLLNKGSISVELIKNDWEDTSDFFESLKQGFDLIRVITPKSEVFIAQPGIFRVNTNADGRTELVVRRGEAVDRRPPRERKTRCGQRRRRRGKHRRDRRKN